MNQIKYLIYATLIFIVLLTGYFLFSLFPAENKIELKQTNNSRENTVATPPPPSRGKELFQQNCQACHALDKRLTGPALRGVTERGPWTEKQNLYKWIQNPAAFISTTPYTKALQKEYGQIMPPFPQLAEKDIDDILEYLSSGGNVSPVAMQ